MRPASDRAQAAIIRAAAALVGADHPDSPLQLVVHELISHDWASITLTGARHRLHLSLNGPGAMAAWERLQAELPEREIPIRGQFLADLAVMPDGEGSTGFMVLALAIQD
jgi:hypothetical protein